MGLRAGLDWCGKSRPTGIRSPDRPDSRQSLYRLSYPAPYMNNRIINYGDIWRDFVNAMTKILSFVTGKVFRLVDN